ncbi:acyl-CoA carboxylase subunit epsilon [Rhodococcus daqingensis]|uniref:Acyl-CoA carboxylase subunit epsilon n=1 Tax=Rhodococcus daqingensis TaxID=2479363 RepID=A0ABW2RUX1_9NOCA
MTATRETTLEDVEVLSAAAEAVDSATVDIVAADSEGSSLPVIKVVKGSPNDIELAALVTVFAAASGAEEAPADTRPAERWGDPTSMHRGAAPLSPYAYPNRR